MSFVYPAFLWALSVLSIPVIIHLFNFRRYKTVYFPDITFLKEVKQETDSRSKVKHLLVLLARLLALAFLVLAFAQPFIKKDETIVPAGKKAVSIYIDNSFSMQSTQGNVPLLELAKKKGYEIINAFEPDDDFQVVTNSMEGRQQQLVNREQAKQLIDEIANTPQVRKLSEVLERQTEILNESGIKSKAVYVISDFQKSSANIPEVNPDSTVRYSYVLLNGTKPANVSIDTCWMKSPLQLVGQPQQLFVRVHNYGDEEIKGGRLSLEINGQTKAIADFNVNAQGVAIDTLSFTPQQAGWNSCVLSVADYPINFDDKFYFAFNALDKVPVMQVFGSKPNTYIDALMRDNSNFTYAVASINQVPYNDLKNNMLVVLNEATNISSGLSAALKEYLTNGGNVLLVPPTGADAASYQSFLQSVNADALQQWNESEWIVNKINVQQGIFTDVFERLPDNMRMPKGKGFYSFSRATASNAEPVIKLDDKNALITQFKVGKGALFVSAVPLDKDKNDLAVSSIFPPMIFKMAITKTYNEALSYNIGNDNTITLPFVAAGKESLIKMKADQEEFIPTQRVIANSTIINTGKAVLKGGIYSFLQPGGGDVNYKAAFNFDRRESNLETWGEKDLENFSTAKKIKLYDSGHTDLSQAIATDSKGLPLWKYCIIFVLAFIAFEILLLKYWK